MSAPHEFLHIELTSQWTVDMFLIFSLRRPNIMPYTDLGVQKGLLRFALTAHNAFPDAKKGKFQLKKKDKVVKDEVRSGEGEIQTSLKEGRATPPPPDTSGLRGRATPPPPDTSGLPPTPLTPTTGNVKRGTLHTPNAPGGSSLPRLPPTPLSPGVAPQETLQVQKEELPEPAPEDLLEPVNGPNWDLDRIAPLGAGLTIELMKSRWSGKKAK